MEIKFKATIVKPELLDADFGRYCGGVGGKVLNSMSIGKDIMTTPIVEYSMKDPHEVHVTTKSGSNYKILVCDNESFIEDLLKYMGDK